MEELERLAFALNQFAGITEEDFKQSIQYWQYQDYKKGDYYNHHKNICRNLGFITNGVFPSYTVDERTTEEKNVFLYSANGFVVSFKSFVNQIPCDYHTQAMTDASKEDLKPAAATAATPAKPAAPPAPASTATPAHIGIEDFSKLDLRIGKVLECGFVDGSDKLLRFLLDAGELGQRQIFSGIRASYAEPEKLVGRHVVFIANLAPRKMRFGLSEGMILSAGFDGGALALLGADASAEAGMPVR